MSIDCFLNLFRDDIKIIHKGYKVFLIIYKYISIIYIKCLDV